jgi:hypothetical protein
MLYLVVGFRHWLRPAEVLMLDWCDVTLIWDVAETCGVVRLRNPKIKAPRVQHVMTELPLARAIVNLIREMFGRPASGRIFPWPPALVARKWANILTFSAYRRLQILIR